MHTYLSLLTKNTQGLVEWACPLVSLEMELNSLELNGSEVENDLA